jgi:hypothetical protein
MNIKSASFGTKCLIALGGLLFAAQLIGIAYIVLRYFTVGWSDYNG